MREIKFRAWVSNHPDVLGTAIPDQMTDEFDFTDFDGDYFIPLGCYYAHMKIMQYTGLKDRNGKEIYEGDLVSCPTCSDEYKVSKVVFSDGAFCIWGVNEKTLQRWMVSQFELEIIGNIYENPDLLEKTDKV